MDEKRGPDHQIPSSADRPELCTERLRLRSLDASDLDDFARLYAQPEVVRFSSSPQPRSRERCATELAEHVAHWREHGFGPWAVTLEGKFIGYVPFNYAGEGLAGIDPDDVEIGWYLLPEYWGRGFAVEAASTVLSDAFRRLGFPDVIAYMRPANAGSIRVAERLAMEPGREARARNGDRVLVYRAATPEAS